MRWGDHGTPHPVLPSQCLLTPIPDTNELDARWPSADTKEVPRQVSHCSGQLGWIWHARVPSQPQVPNIAESSKVKTAPQAAPIAGWPGPSADHVPSSAELALQIRESAICPSPPRDPGGIPKSDYPADDGHVRVKGKPVPRRGFTPGMIVCSRLGLPSEAVPRYQRTSGS